MPSVVHPPSSDFPHFPLVRYPSHREGRNTAAMTGLAVLIVFDDFFWEGESRKCGLGGQKSRFHRHRTRPLGVDDCGRVEVLVTVIVDSRWAMLVEPLAAKAPVILPLF